LLGRQLQQHRQELPVGEPQQERPVYPQRQPGLPPFDVARIRAFLSRFSPFSGAGNRRREPGDRRSETATTDGISAASTHRWAHSATSQHPPCPEFRLAGKIPDSRRNRSPSSPPLVLTSEGREIKS
jgi:hypothetical protein